MSHLVLDAGALIAFERADRRAVLLIAEARARRAAVTIPAAVVGQVWRDGRRQSRLARLLAAADIHVEPLDDLRARAAGQLCGATGTADVVDAAVVLCALEHDAAIATSDVDDLARLSAKVPLVRV